MALVPIDMILTHTCNISPREGRDENAQPTFGADVLDVACRYLATHQTLTDVKGDIVTARAIFLITPDYPSELLDQSIIHIGPKDFEVILAAAVADEEQGSIHHWEVLCR